MPQTTKEQKIEVISQFQSGKSLNSISKSTKISRTTIYYIIERFKKDPTTLENRPKSGRPPKLSHFEQKLILRKSLADPKLTSRGLLSSVQLSRDVSTSYVRKLLLRHGLKSKIFHSKLFLSKENRLKRLYWAKEMSQKNEDFWNGVIFSDETMIELFPKRRLYLCVPKKFPPNIAQHAKFGGKKLMFWGFIKKSGERKLIKVENRVNSAVYINVLASSLLPNMYLDEVFQQDNAPAHKSAETKTWFYENGVQVLENWPPNSPDLNIIENLWSIMKTNVGKRHPKNVEELERVVLEEFFLIPNSYVEKLFKSIKTRVNLTIINRGGFTKY